MTPAADRADAQTLADLYLRWATLRPDDVVAIFTDRGDSHAYTRHEMVEEVSAAAGGMRDVGVGPGDRVVIAHPTSISFVASFWATQLLGAIAVPAWSPGPTGKLWGASRLRRIVDSCSPRAVAMEPGAHERLQAEGWTCLPPLVERARRRVAPGEVSVRPDDIAVLQFTSGSTASPRGCMLSHRSILVNVALLTERSGIAPGEVGVSWCPLYHDMGLMGSVVFPFYRDLRQVFQRTESFIANPLSWLRLIATHRAAVTPAPNFAFALVNRKLRGQAPDLDLSCLREIINGGEPIIPAVTREFVGTLAPCGVRPTAMHPAWGLAENVVLAASSPGGMRTVVRSVADSAADPTTTGAAEEREVVSVGRPLPETQIRVVEHRRHVQDGHVGEILLRSPSLMSGYWEDEEATGEVLHEGWLRTGDLGFVHEGELYLVGRSKEVIVLAGRNLLPYDVEEVTASVSGVRAGSVIACGMQVDGTEGLLVLAEYRGSDPDRTRRDIALACRRDLDVLPRKVVLVARGALPKTTSGKLQRGHARSLYEAGQLVDRFDGRP